MILILVGLGALGLEISGGCRYGKVRAILFEVSHDLSSSGMGM